MRSSVGVYLRASNLSVADCGGERGVFQKVGNSYKLFETAMVPMSWRKAKVIRPSRLWASGAGDVLTMMLEYSRPGLTVSVKVAALSEQCLQRWGRAKCCDNGARCASGHGRHCQKVEKDQEAPTVWHFWPFAAQARQLETTQCIQRKTTCRH